MSTPATRSTPRSSGGTVSVCVCVSALEAAGQTGTDGHRRPATTATAAAAAPVLRDRLLPAREHVTYRWVLAATRSAVRRQRVEQYMLTEGWSRSSRCPGEKEASSHHTGSSGSAASKAHGVLTYPQCSA